MRIVILESPKAVTDCAAKQILRLLEQRPASVLGLATGSTPLALYASLIEYHQRQQLSFSQCQTFNLDEYLGLKGDHPQSYSHYMRRHFFQHVDLPPDSIHLLDGNTNDPEQECANYEASIRASGGIDLQLLGIGRNGHIGFNEPSSSLGSRARVKTLTLDTIAANRRFFTPEEFQPTLALTMGIGTIMEARHILLMAAGTAKAQAIRDTIEGPLAARCPASILQMHPKVTLVIDREAAGELEQVEFYQHIERENKNLLLSNP